MKRSKFKVQIDDTRGQILLVLIMMLATSITVILATAFTARTDVQITALEQESQKALAAAEAGIDVALQQGAPIGDIGSLSGLDEFEGGVEIDTTGNSTQFSTPVLRRDEQYTYYLANYDRSSNSFSAPFSGTITIYYGSGAILCNDVALELTIISGSAPSYRVTRFIADRGDRLSSNTGDIVDPVYLGGFSLDGLDFKCRTQPIAINSVTYPDVKLLFIRSLFSQSHVAIEGSSILPAQGRTVTSEARSATGVTKIVELFQSNPQLPADFFVTRL